MVQYDILLLGSSRTSRGGKCQGNLYAYKFWAPGTLFTKQSIRIKHILLSPPCICKSNAERGGIHVSLCGSSDYKGCHRYEHHNPVRLDFEPSLILVCLIGKTSLRAQQHFGRKVVVHVQWKLHCIKGSISTMALIYDRASQVVHERERTAANHPPSIADRLPIQY